MPSIHLWSDLGFGNGCVSLIRGKRTAPDIFTLSAFVGFFHSLIQKYFLSTSCVLGTVPNNKKIDAFSLAGETDIKQIIAQVGINL